MTVRVEESVCDVLGMLQDWLVDERFAESRLIVLSQNAVDACSEDGLAGLVQAGMWGLVRAAQSEHPERVTLVDIDGRDCSLGVLPVALASVREPQLAIRNGEALVAKLVRVAARGRDGDSVDGLQSSIDPQGTVLVTGGLGGLGRLVARHLVSEHGVRSLLLAGRRGIDTPGAAELVDELEGHGARVHVVACDVSDRDAVRRLLDDVPVEFPLRGVVHMAGVLDDGVIESLNRGSVARALAPKAHAAWHLHEVTEQMDLSMFALFSSAAATLGSPGQGNYAAANSFLDGLAAYRRARGLPGVSIAWGHWDQANGMTSELRATDLARMRRQRIQPLSAVEGCKLFDVSLTRQEAHIIPMRLDVTAPREQEEAERVHALLRGLIRISPKQASDGSGSSFRQRLAVAPRDRLEDLVLELIKAEVTAVLGYASPLTTSPNATFNEMGFDSLAAVELRIRLNAATGLRLPATTVFDYPTPGVLANRILHDLTESDAADVTPVDAELARLESVFSSIHADSPAAKTITERLQALLLRSDSNQQTNDRAAVAEKIDVASDDAIFAFLDGDTDAL
jgi:NAD(P)-dependent dehydrogenase (short-subunit alcohol dehydrogenase family)/acyl carrier protein